MNNGQACIAGTRLLVPRTRLDEVIGAVQAFAATLRVGDPKDPDTTMGPLASLAQYQRVQHYIQRGLAQGARLIVGGEGRPAGLEQGYFARPTVFANVSQDMDIAREEIFGPVLSIMTYDSDEQAIEIANGTEYGLYAYVFSSNLQRASHIASRLEAGTVMINRINPELLAPFGGVKQSGIGREFGVAGLESFLEAKTIVTGV
jgi:aldehyde dehydrogenase (NAD+)